MTKPVPVDELRQRPWERLSEAQRKRLMRDATWLDEQTKQLRALMQAHPPGREERG